MGKKKLGWKPPKEKNLKWLNQNFLIELKNMFKIILKYFLFN